MFDFCFGLSCVLGWFFKFFLGLYKASLFILSSSKVRKKKKTKTKEKQRQMYALPERNVVYCELKEKKMWLFHLDFFV